MLPYKEAVEKYKEAVRFFPDFVDAWYGRCFAFLVNYSCNSAWLGNGKGNGNFKT
jgi:hypothetical protein